MADEDTNEDQWLYGDSAQQPPGEPAEEGEVEGGEAEPHPPGEEPPLPLPPAEEQPPPPPPPPAAEEASLEPAGDEADGDGDGDGGHDNHDDDDELPPGVDAAEAAGDVAVAAACGGGGAGENGTEADSDEDSDDDVNVVIGDIKATPAYGSLNIKRLASTADKAKSAGKFSIEEFETVGSINGVPAPEFNLDTLEDKPWRKPGADITDYFNYGFNEDTWRAYCERQKRLRVHESGVGLAPMNSIGMPRSNTSITNENSKYSGTFLGPKKAGPPPGRRMTGSIDVIGGTSGVASRRGMEGMLKTPPKENVIQVMTADRREYSRKPGFGDLSLPPPGTFEAGAAPPSAAAAAGAGFDAYSSEAFFNEPEPYYGGNYEPTQDLQWNNSESGGAGGGAEGGAGDASWTPSDIKTLTPGNADLKEEAKEEAGSPAPSREEKSASSRHRERGDRDRSDRDRERSHRRERSRSRSRRHKSRSRSPGHRSHRKKKSRRHEKDDSD